MKEYERNQIIFFSITDSLAFRNFCSCPNTAIGKQKIKGEKHLQMIATASFLSLQGFYFQAMAYSHSF